MKYSLNWREFFAKALAGGLILCSVIFLILFVGMCFVYFPPRGYRPTLESLGLYGDFFGGILGTILSMASLGVTVYLAMVLHRLEKENTQSAIEAQRKVAIMQFKLKEFALFNEQCELCLQTLPSAADNHEAIDMAYKSILSAFGRITTLFPDLDTRGNNLEIMDFVSNLKTLCDYSKEVNLKMSQHQPRAVIDDLHRKMFDHLGVIHKDHHKLMKKLSDWALE